MYLVATSIRSSLTKYPRATWSFLIVCSLVMPLLQIFTSHDWLPYPRLLTSALGRTWHICLKSLPDKSRCTLSQGQKPQCFVAEKTHSALLQGTNRLVFCRIGQTLTALSLECSQTRHVYIAGSQLFLLAPCLIKHGLSHRVVRYSRRSSLGPFEREGAACTSGDMGSSTGRTVRSLSRPAC
jgi:hypothetical protein